MKPLFRYGRGQKWKDSRRSHLRMGDMMKKVGKMTMAVSKKFKLCFKNVGGELAETNYWQSPQAEDAVLYSSIHEGVMRLLMPEQCAPEVVLDSMVSSTGAKLEHDQYSDDVSQYLLSFSDADGPGCDFCITLNPAHFDRNPAEQNINELIVYTKDGAQVRLPFVSLLNGPRYPRLSIRLDGTE